METIPKISIVIPSFNQAAYLEETLRSVIDQNYPNTEIILMDGGSKDGSLEIIKKYSSHLAYWVSAPDGGQTQALVDGFKRTTGEIQCWLNSDDLLLPGSLHFVGRFFQNNPGIEVIYGDSIWADASGRQLRVQKEIPFHRFVWFHTYNYIPGMSTFWRKSIYERVGGLDPEFNLAMDADLWIRFSDTGTQLKHVREILSKTRFHPQQKTRMLGSAGKQEVEKIYRRYHASESPWFFKTKRMAARVVRVVWRGVTGCYQAHYRAELEKLESVQSS